jgi:tRNA-splicing endonuclease subunit Sen54
MHTALSFPRIHPPKGHSVATYHPETNMAFIYNPKGALFMRMGTVLSAKEDPLGNDEFRGQRMWLLPEEVLYLLERGSLDVRWPVDSDDAEESLPMSLQAAYAMFIGDDASHDGHLTLERYTVYAGLKRSGYTVLRAPSWDNPGPPPGTDCYASFPSMPRRAWHVGLIDYFTSSMRFWPTGEDPFEKEQRFNKGPLVRSQLYRSYAEIYRKLAIVPWHDPTSRFGRNDIELETDPAFRVTFHVWKPGSTMFKKSDPGPPDFRIAVVNARETSVPTSDKLSALMEKVPYNAPTESSQLYQKLKHGYKSVILAIVDQGVVSYLRFSDAAFGREKLYDRKPRGYGGKRGGRGGRGRGR